MEATRMRGYDFAQHFNELDRGEIYTNIRNTNWHDDAVYEKFSPQEFERRRRLAREKMARLGLDCIVVPGGSNSSSMGQGLVWLSGHMDVRRVLNYLVFPMEGEPTLLVGMGGSHAEAFRRAVSVDDVRPGGNFGLSIAERIEELGLAQGTIGLVTASSERRGAEHLPVNYYLTLREKLPGAKLELVDRFFHQLMNQKSEEEVRFIRRAGRLCDRALHAMAAIARPGVTEAELAAAAAQAMIAGGGVPHLIIIGITSQAQPNAVFGNPKPSGRRLEEGDLIVNELGAWYQGTSAQVGNPMVLGELTQDVRHFYEDVIVPGFRVMADQLRPGRTLDDVQKAGGLYFRDRGYQSRPLHIHGIDIVTESPVVLVHGVEHLEVDYELKPGMELMLEPCPITADGKLGIFLGRTYVITDEGHELMTRYPLEMTYV